MIVGVMQPYLFPYLGYYQLVNYCDKFVFYDDANYIKGGYINRNYILVQQKKQLITIPVINSSSFKRINELNFVVNVKKTIKTIEQSYSKAPYFDEVMPMIFDVFNAEDRNVSNIASLSIKKVFTYLDIEKNFLFSSDLNYDREQSASDKVLSMCKILGSTRYCNSIGGKKLYEKDDFLLNKIKLLFLRMNNIYYSQGKIEFIENLSIIDVLMWNSLSEIRSLLLEFEIE